jgi:hypothetical protein
MTARSPGAAAGPDTIRTAMFEHPDDRMAFSDGHADMVSAIGHSLLAA